MHLHSKVPILFFLFFFLSFFAVKLIRLFKVGYFWWGFIQFLLWLLLTAMNKVQLILLNKWSQNKKIMKMKGPWGPQCVLWKILVSIIISLQKIQVACAQLVAKVYNRFDFDGPLAKLAHSPVSRKSNYDKFSFFKAKIKPPQTEGEKWRKDKK